MEKKELQDVLDAARREERERQYKRDLEFEAQRVMLRDEETIFQEDLLPKLRIAGVEDYVAWLKGYIENGGKPTHVYNYPFARWEWYVVMGDIEPVALHGSARIDIIIPAGTQTGTGDWGHCHLFFMEGYKATGIVPIFSDTNLNS